MADVATLGLAVDSTQVKSGADQLPSFEAVAKQTGATVDRVQAQFAVATKSFAGIVPEVGKTNAAFAALTAQHVKVAASTDKVAVSNGLARHEMINLSRQIQDIGVSLVSGQSPFLVGIQQGSQLADIFMSSKNASVEGAIKQVGAAMANFLTPMRAVGLGVAASGATAYAAYGMWKNYTLGLDDAAKAANVSTANFSKLQAAAQIKGISPDEFTKGISEFSRNVYEAQHGLGDLANVFRANNKLASSFDDYLEKAADLIRNSGNDQQRLVLLQQMGLPATMEWVRLLNGGAEGLRRAKQEAAEFAANDSLILAARRFNEGWNTAGLLRRG